MAAEPVKSPSQTPLEALLRRAKRDPDALALVAGSQTWSCERLADQSARVARSFRAFGVQLGDRIALHMPNVPETAVAYLACWRVGATAVPLNTRQRASELAEVLGRVQPALFLGHAEFYEAVADVDTDALPLDIRIIAGPQTPHGTLPPGACCWTKRRIRRSRCHRLSI